MPETGKKLTELKICDLKSELEKRKLDTLGAKIVLSERLEQALIKEGEDPAKYVFLINTKIASNANEEEATTKDIVHIKKEPADDECAKDTVNNAKVYAIVKRENESNENYEEYYEEHNKIDQVGDVDDECVLIEEEEDPEEESNENLKEKKLDEAEVQNGGDANNQDHEESINLTIGEDEQALLHDEDAEDKEKPAETSGNQKENADATKENKGEKVVSIDKDEKKTTKEEDAAKAKKKDEKAGDKKDASEQKTTSSKTPQKDEKEKSTNASAGGITATITKTIVKGATTSRNLWVSGLSSLTRASDLKTIFSKYGKVIGAKVVTNTRTPGTRCYGYVTMSSTADATRCIEHLHRTELHGRIISVERTKNEIGSSAAHIGKDGVKQSDAKRKDDEKKSSSGKDASNDRRKRDSSRHSSRRDGSIKSKRDDKDKDKDKEKSGDRKDESVKDGSHRSESHRRTSADRHRARDYDRERELRQRERERDRMRQIREERERQRLREKERQLREEERRRREIRERQRQEEERLAEERKKLAQERERLEREKAELLRLERERQKLEREKIELERLELKRQQLKIMQAREEPIKRTIKRSADDRYTEVTDRKRSTGSDSRFEAPPPPRFDTSLVATRSYDKKRDDFSSSSTTKRIDYPKRDDYSTSSSKRTIDDYGTASSKRSTEDYSKRSNSDYISSSSSKRSIDDYSANKNSRDEYKREVEIRHIPVTNSSSVTSTFHSNRDISSAIHKVNRSYIDSDRNNTSNYRRIDDMSNNKRYDNTSAYGGNGSGTVWANNSPHMGHSSHNNNGMSSTWQKTNDDNTNWRPAQTPQDRYDRTFNERSGGYQGGGSSGGMFGGGGRPGQDRYGPPVSSRY